MRRLVSVPAAVVLAAALSPAAVSAAPPPSFVVAFGCSDGQTYDISFGTPKNNGAVGFVVGTNAVVVAKQFTLTIGDEVLIESTRGVQGFDPAALMTCVGTSGPLTFTVVGWVTPVG